MIRINKRSKTSTYWMSGDGGRRGHRGRIEHHLDHVVEVLLIRNGGAAILQPTHAAIVGSGPVLGGVI